MTAVCSSSYFAELVEGIAYWALSPTHQHQQDNMSWVGWHRHTTMVIEYLINVAYTPKGFDFVDDTDAVSGWSEAQPPGHEDCGTHGAIHALYITPLTGLLSKFERSIYALTAIRP